MPLAAVAVWMAWSRDTRMVNFMVMMIVEFMFCYFVAILQITLCPLALVKPWWT
jgi:uncharacterized membrane protein YcaP (DUF421 family)